MPFLSFISSLSISFLLLAIEHGTHHTKSSSPLLSDLYKSSKNLPASSTQSQSSSIFQCWDGCFDTKSLSTLLFGGETRSHGFTTIIDRNDNNAKPRSAIESAILSILNEMDGNTVENRRASRFVEYWWRDNGKGQTKDLAKPVQMLEAHRDIDEALCRKNQIPLSLGSDVKLGMQKCPTFGHVLYVDVDENIRAPTLLWEEEEENVNDDSEKSSSSQQQRQYGGARGGGPPRKLKTLWPIPAVSNRLLRFRGDCLHAASSDQPLSFLDSDNDDKEEEMYKAFSFANGRRAVLLFNTWERSPLSPPEVGEDLSVTERNLVEQIMAGCGDCSSLPTCMPKSKWISTQVLLGTSSSSIHPNQNMTTFSFPLLGDISRRGCVEQTLSAHVQKEDAIKALASNSVVHGVVLHSIYNCRQ